eukprot:scaffold6246_cov162-Ochromonas_danica.AAC.3
MKVISPNKKLDDMAIVSANVIQRREEENNDSLLLSHPNPNPSNPTPPSQPMPSTGRRPSASHTTNKHRYLTFESDRPEDVKVSPTIIAMNTLHSVITLRPLQGKCTVDQGKPSPPRPLASSSRKMRGRSSLLMCGGEGSCLVLSTDPSAEQEQLLLLSSPSTPSLLPLSPPSRSEQELMKGYFNLGTSLFSSSSSCVEEEPKVQPAFTLLKEVSIEETLPGIQAYREAIASRPSSSFDGFPHILPVIDVLHRSASPPGTRNSVIFDDSPLPSPKHAEDKEEKGKKLLVELHLPKKPLLQSPLEKQDV